MPSAGLHSSLSIPVGCLGTPRRGWAVLTLFRGGKPLSQEKLPLTSLGRGSLHRVAATFSHRTY
jgi:hypothetical protein